MTFAQLWVIYFTYNYIIQAKMKNIKGEIYICFVDLLCIGPQ